MSVVVQAIGREGGVAYGGKIGSKTIDKLFGNLVLREDNGVVI